MASPRRVRHPPGDAVMHGAWMPKPGESWLGATASFTGMWVVMMAAMMLPSFTPVLWRYRQAWRAAGSLRPLVLLALTMSGYLLVWGAIGLVVLPIGATMATLTMTRSSLAPVISILQGAVVLAAGVLQFTSWKAHHLACWRASPVHDVALPSHPATAWRLGLRLGLHCAISSAGPTAALLAIGMMDLRAMTVVTAAITAERLSPAGERVARILGGLAVGVGLLTILLARPVSPGLPEPASPASPDHHILTINR